MKKNKQSSFSRALHQYKRYKRKYSRLLENTNTDSSKLEFLRKRILKLKEIIQAVFQNAKLATAAGAFGMVMVSSTADAQNFTPYQVNPFNLTNVGGSGYSSPAFVDIDGDGDFDMMSGSYYYSDFYYYENTGTVSAPLFGAAQTNPFGLTSTGTTFSAPTFIDIDGDGDFDMFSNSYNGDFVYYENTGDANNPVFAASSSNPFLLANIGNLTISHPTFADIDGDGDFDVLMGDDGYNDFLYFENTGNSALAAFGPMQITPFSLSTYDSWHSPTFFDFDGDGDYDIFNGYNSGDFSYYENTGDAITPVFGPEQVNPFSLSNIGRYSNLTLKDLDNDGLIDIMAGEQGGSFYFFKGCVNTSATISPTAICSYVSPSGNYTWSSSNTYTDVLTNASGCDSIITINLTINPIADQAITNTTLVACDAGAATMNLTSQSGVNYYLRDNTNDTIVDGPIVGTGSGIALSTGPVSSTMTYNVYGDKPTNTTGLYFDGTNAFNTKVDCGNSASVQLSGTQITLEAWIYPTVWRGINQGHVINKEFNGGLGSDLGYMIRCGDGGKISFNLGGGNWNELVTTTTPLVLNTWQHIAATYDGAVMSIYVDGNLIDTKNTTVNFSAPNNNLTIGSWAGGNGSIFPGIIDEVRVWSVNKTQGELQSAMNTCLTGSETGLAAYYQFEDGVGSSILTDLSPNGNNGTLMNMDVNTDWITGSIVCSTCNIQMTQLVTVNVGQSTTGSISPVACNSYTSPSGNFVWTAGGLYTDTIPNASGCDSIIDINLTINLIDNSTTTSVDTVTANQAGASYRWLDCDNSYAIISGEVGQSFVATNSGNYAVEVTINSCTDTSTCVNMTTVGINKSLINNQLAIYPNPSIGNFNIQSTTAGTYAIVNGLGQTVQSFALNADNNFSINIEKLNQGIYFITGYNNNQLTNQKIIVTN